MGEILLFNKFFLTVDTCLSCEDVARQSCAMVPDGDFLRRAFPARRVQHISDMHSKFALSPHHVSKYGRHPICERPLRLGEEKKTETTGQTYNVRICYAGRP